MERKLLTRSQVASMGAPKSRPAMLDWIKRRAFPRPVYLTANRPMWWSNEVAEWFENQTRSHSTSLAAGKRPLSDGGANAV